MSRKRYVRAMMSAIKKAAAPVFDFEPKASKTDGLRVIRRFERVNQTVFDPFDSTHVFICSGWGSTESFFRRINHPKPL